MDIRKTRTCEKCKGVIPLDKVRLVPKSTEGNWLVCEPCAAELRNAKLETRIPSLPAKEYQNMTCERCSYTFRIDLGKVKVTHNLLCPYCGKDDRLKKGVGDLR